MSDDSRRLLEELAALAAARHAFEGDHPSPELIEEHVLGTVPAALARRVEAHIAICPECAALAADLRAFPDLEPPAGQRPLTAAELAADWERLQARINKPAVPADPPGPVRVPFPEPSARPEPRSPPAVITPPQSTSRDRAYEAVVGSRAMWRALAACLALVLAGGAIWYFQGSPRLTSGGAIQIVDLSPVDLEGDEVRGGGKRPLHQSQVALILNLKEAAKPPASFRVEIFDGDRPADARPIFSKGGISPSEHGNLHLLFGRADLPERRARILVHQEGEDAAPPMQYFWDLAEP